MLLRAETSVEIDLQEQRAYLLQNGRPVLASPISSGRYGHLTEGGSFKVIEKERNHYSSIYGKIVDASGRTVVADADVDMKVPSGCRFVPAPMPYFMRFHGSDGMHAGYLPGYPASHGCVRMPDQVCSCILQRSERRHSRHCVRQDASQPLLLRPNATRFSAPSTFRAIHGSGLSASASSGSMVAVK